MVTWWHEGIHWLKAILLTVAGSQTMKTVIASRWIEEHPPTQALLLPESSWGTHGTHETWDNEQSHWMWQEIHQVERRLEHLVATLHLEQDAVADRIMQQAAREALLLESSDWPFLLTTGQAADYAEQRFNSHRDRFAKLADALDSLARGDSFSEAIIEESQHMQWLDNPFCRG